MIVAVELPRDLVFSDQLIASLAQAQGVKVVLGGSRAKGTHHPGSDFDIGLYYDSESPLDTKQLCQIVKYSMIEGKIAF